MATFETYEKRKRREERADEPEIYQYDAIPRSFRNQVIHIWNDVIGKYHSPIELFRTTGRVINQNSPLCHIIWDEIHDNTARAAGLLHLNSGQKSSRDNCVSYLLSEDTNTDGILSLIEVSFHIAEAQDYYDNVAENESDFCDEQRRIAGITQSPTHGIAELNQRFKEHSLGYQYMDGEIVRVDSHYLHSETVKPALVLLQSPEFAAADQEFRKAHTHYRNSDNEAAITEACKAFESTLKIICAERGWQFDNEKDKVNTLIRTVLTNGLLPEFMENQITRFQEVLVGLASIRNKRGAHGGGVAVIPVPGYLAAYALHLAAANIVLLVEAHKAVP